MSRSRARPATSGASRPGDLKPRVKCFVSIGAGYPSARAVEDSVARFLKSTLAGIATEIEDTAQRFAACWGGRPDGEDRRSYLRFNVQPGLQDVGLAECSQEGLIEAATERYSPAH